MSWTMLGPAALHPDPNRIGGGIPTITPDDVRLALGGLDEKPFLFGMAAFLGHRGSMDRVEQLLEWDLMAYAERHKWGDGRDGKGRPTGELSSKDIEVLQRMARLMLFEVISARSRHDTYAHEATLPAGSAAVLCPNCRGRGDESQALAEIERLQQKIRQLSCESLMRGLTFAAREARAGQLGGAYDDLELAEKREISDACWLCDGHGRFLLTETRRAQMVCVARATWYRRWEAHYADALAIPQRWESIAIGHVRRRLRGDA